MPGCGHFSRFPASKHSSICYLCLRRVFPPQAFSGPLWQRSLWTPRSENLGFETDFRRPMQPCSPASVLLRPKPKQPFQSPSPQKRDIGSWLQRYALPVALRPVLTFSACKICSRAYITRHIPKSRVLHAQLALLQRLNDGSQWQWWQTEASSRESSQVGC